jgi:sigma-B regulation protein RsbU (phosphoserine phosphatase)
VSRSLLRLAIFYRQLSLLDRIAIALLLFYAFFRGVSPLSRWLPFPTFFGFLAFLAVLYLLVRLQPWVRTRLLWRLRNRLIVAYVFIALVPVVLLLAMAGAASYLLYLQIGAHLLRDHLQEQIATVASYTAAIADEVATEAGQGTRADATTLSHPRIVALLRADKTESPDFQVFLNRGLQLATGNTGRFRGMVEFERKLWLASVERRTTSDGPVFIFAGEPVSPALLDRLGAELGPIQLILLRPLPMEQKGTSGLTIGGIRYVDDQEVTSRNRRIGPRANWFDIRVNGAATFEAQHIDPQSRSNPDRVLASFSLRPMMVNSQIFSSGGELGSLLIDLLLLVAAVFLILEIAAFVTGLILTRTITRSIGDLYEATRHVRRGDFSYRVRVHTADQLGSLGESFNEMTSSISDLIAEQRKRQRLEHEIAIAREVQDQLFPRSLPSVPGIELGAICRAARSVSGDYYDFIRIGPRQLGIALADISGKGIFAALLMASVQAALRSMAAIDGHDGTAALVSRLNDHLFKNTSDDRYATFFYAVYDAAAETLTYTNAGHLAPFFVHGGKVERLDEGGTVVGLFEGAAYTQGTLKVTPGSILVAFSDGLTEPENVYGEEFGIDRLRDEILRQRNAPPQRVAENLIAAADQWAGTPEQADDITVVVARMD